MYTAVSNPNPNMHEVIRRAGMVCIASAIIMIIMMWEFNYLISPIMKDMQRIRIGKIVVDAKYVVFIYICTSIYLFPRRPAKTLSEDISYRMKL